MAFDWQDYLQLARFLRGQPGDGFAREAALRSAVSRAYYAAFCHARNRARDEHGFRPTGTPEDHRLVQDFLRRLGLHAAADDLDDLRKWRNACDYDDVVHNADAVADSAIRRAQAVVNATG